MQTSVNPNTNKIINIPKILDDKENINDFLKSNSGKKIVVVQGLGFVGAVMCLVCANAINEDYAVIGVDVADDKNYWKIKSINDGIFPIISSDKKIPEYFSKAKKKNNFYATYDSYAYSKADFIIVDINLDVEKDSDFYGNLNDYNVNLKSFKSAIKTIGMNMKDDSLILVETTVPPGTCSNFVKPIIEDCLKDRGLDTNSFRLGHSYERVMPGPNYIDSIQNYFRVYSGIDDKSANATESFLRTIISTKKFPLTRLGCTNATEIAKVLENSYRAMNISFITEWSRFAEESNVNLYEVIDAIRLRPTHSNIMFPGIGVGGYCLTKDPLLASWSKTNIFNSDTPLSLSENGVIVNDKMPLYAFEFMKKSFNLKNLKNINILLCGVSYRSNVADTRYTPVEKFYNFCFKQGANLMLHDPYVKYWEEMSLDINNNLSEILKSNFEIVVMTTSHDEYSNDSELVKYLSKRQKLLIYDTVGCFTDTDIKKISKNNKIIVLGRGDLKI